MSNDATAGRGVDRESAALRSAGSTARTDAPRDALRALAEAVVTAKATLEAYRDTPFRDYDANRAARLYNEWHNATHFLAQACTPEVILSLVGASATHDMPTPPTEPAP